MSRRKYKQTNVSNNKIITYLIPSTAPNLLASNQISNLQVVIPPHPAPVHTVVGWLLNLINLAHLPMLSSISSDFTTGDATSTSSVGISSNIVGSSNIGSEIDGLIVIRSSHGGVNVELVEDVFGLVPPSSSEGLLGGDVRRQDTVIVVMVVVLGLMLNNINVSEPLDHTSTNVSRDDETDWVSVIGLESLAVGFVGDEDVVGGVHGTSKRDGSSVLDELCVEGINVMRYMCV